MTAVHEELHHLVDRLDDDEATSALAFLRAQLGEGRPRRRPKSIGIGRSGRGDLSERVDDLLAEGFGR